LCYPLEGRVRLPDGNGAFVIPAGLEGVFETLEPVKMIFTIWQARTFPAEDLMR
jgi:uncharacterized cupin superfamily protein